MNRIILIGNGFDLAHGLPTSYAQFIDKLWENIVIKISEEAEFDDELFSFKIKPENQNQPIHPNQVVERKLFNNMPQKNYQNLKDRIDLINDRYKGYFTIELQYNNLLFKHLTTNCIGEKNWVDIEEEYYKFLTHEFNTGKHTGYDYKDTKTLNRDFESLKQKLNDYLIDIPKNHEVRPSEKMFSMIFRPILLKEFTDIGKESIANDEYWKVVREKNGGSDGRHDEMSRKTAPLLKNYINFDGQELKKVILCDIQKENRAEQYFDLKVKDLLFLNFNYTDTEKYYTSGLNINTIHIHGEVNNLNNPIIFGYGDELEENYSKLENLQDNDYLENIKSIQYLETDNYKKMLSFIDSDKYQVIILGHSCGNSDRTLLNTLFEHKNCVSIKPYYYQYKDQQTGEIKDNYSDIVRNISRSFTNKKSMRDKVVNKKYTDWFSSNID